MAFHFLITRAIEEKYGSGHILAIINICIIIGREGLNLKYNILMGFCSFLPLFWWERNSLHPTNRNFIFWGILHSILVNKTRNLDDKQFYFGYKTWLERMYRKTIDKMFFESHEKIIRTGLALYMFVFSEPSFGGSDRFIYFLSNLRLVITTSQSSSKFVTDLQHLDRSADRFLKFFRLDQVG